MKSVWLLLGIAVVVQAAVVKKVRDDESESLEWPTTFTLKAIRTSITDHVVESCEIWKTSSGSRIDYYDGSVKTITKYGKPNRFGIQYAVFPVADEEQEVEVACLSRKGTKYHRIRPENVLPDDEYYYEAVGQETMNDKECTKFTYDFSDETTDARNSIWAYYDKSASVWVPVRYEVLEFNSWLGSKDKHEIWDFFDFETSFSLRKVFNVDDYECEEMDDDEDDDKPKAGVSKKLWFVNPDKDHHVDHMFHRFKKQHARTYADEKEHSMRRSIFKRNLRRVIQHNRRNLSYKMGINQFADRLPEEMNQYMGLKRRPEGKVGNVPFPYDQAKLAEVANDLPEECDLRLQGLVTKVKNQEDCGSCWTFGTTAAVEGALARVNGGQLMSLSNQALVDCAWAFGAGGCHGGTDNAAYEWMMKYGLPTEAEYGPYLNQDSPCRILNMTKTYPIRGFTDVTPLSETALKVAVVNHGPLSVSVHVTDDFSMYSSGIFYDLNCDETSLNHEVTLVGYGVRDGDTFWIIKNSWGPNWGIGGYMYISARDNNCGIATEPTYVVI